MSNIERRAEFQAQRAAKLAAFLEDLLPLRGDERVLDVGAGNGSVRIRGCTACARGGRGRARRGCRRPRQGRVRPTNVEVVVGNGEELSFDSFSFDVTATVRTLHHTPRPELVVAELVRVTRPGGTILVADQLASVDPLEAAELNAFERARDPSTTRVMADGDLRGLFDSNNLVLRRAEVVRESRDLEEYLDLAGLERTAARLLRATLRRAATRRSPAGTC